MNSDHNTPDAIAKISKTMMVVAWVIALTLITVFFNHVLEKQYNPNGLPGELANGAEHKQVVLKRNRQHHYVADGFINQQQVTFLVDTGATNVAIPAALAKKLALEFGAPGYAHTANGTTQTRATRINELKLGSITLHNVDASITMGMTGNEILLGMSALKDVEFTHRNGELTLKHYQ